MANLEVGSWNKLPHYIVVGNATKFYIWINEDGRGAACKWIAGRDGFTLFNKLKSMNTGEFIAQVKTTFKEHI